MNKSILCLFVIACVVAISHAFPSAEESAKADLGESFGTLAQSEGHQHDGLAQVEGDENLNRQKRQFGFGGYGGYGGYGGGFRRYGGYGGGYGGYGGGYRRRFYGGYGGYGR